MEEQKYREGGFIKLYRSMLKWEWYDDINVKVLFLHLLLKANYEDKRWRGIEIKRGELITSTSQLSKETGLSIQQVKTCLAKLKQTGEITYKATKQYTLISVEKYGFFQCYSLENNLQNNLQITHEQPTSNLQATYEQPTSNLRVTTTKELKENNNNNKYNKPKENVYQLIADMYNATCVSFPPCTELSEARIKALQARLKKYTVEDFKKLFEIAEQCNSLKGANDKNWSANFDWLIANSNMSKTLEGSYLDKNTQVQNIPKKDDESDIAKMLDSVALLPELQQKVKEWLEYKNEKKQSYKPTGLKSLLVKIENHQNQYGQKALIEAIDDAMANNWQGIVWENVAKQNTQKTVKPAVKRNRFVNYEQRDWDFEELEELARKRLQETDTDYEFVYSENGNLFRDENHKLVKIYPSQGIPSDIVKREDGRYYKIYSN